MAENYKVADISLWEWGRKEIVIGKKLFYQVFNISKIRATRNKEFPFLRGPDFSK